MVRSHAGSVTQADSTDAPTSCPRSRVIASSESSELVRGRSRPSSRQEHQISRLLSPSWRRYSSEYVGFFTGILRGTLAPRASWNVEPAAPPQLTYQQRRPR